MKILQLTHQNIPINYYRHWQFAKHLNDMGHTILTRPHSSLSPFGYKDTINYKGVKRDYCLDYDFLDAIAPGCDAIWSTICYEPHRLATLMAAREAYGIPIIIDTDDLVTDIPKYNVAQQKLTSKSDRIKIALAGFRHADALTTTCAFLAEALKKYNSNVFITENNIEPSTWTMERKPTPANEVRILWAGSTARYGDIQMIRRPLESIIKRYKGSSICVKLIFIATVPDFAVEWIDAGDAFVLQWADMIDYQAVTRYIAPDIGLSPLVPSDFNRSKSPLKYFDYTMMGAAGVYSDECTYSCVEDGVTGIKLKGDAGWESALIKLIENPILRKDIIHASSKDVLANYSILKNAPRIASTLEEAVHVGSSHCASVRYRANAS